MNTNEKTEVAVGGIAAGAIILYLLTRGSSTVTPPLTDAWQLTVQVSPENTGTTNLTGTTRRPLDSPTNITAVANDGWSFDYWEFDGSMYDTIPNTVIVPQTKDSIHTLVAHFVVALPAFEIIPNRITTAGVSTDFWLSLVNNSNAEINSVRIRLNDPYGVFQALGVGTSWKQGSWSWNSFYWKHEDSVCLNIFSGGTVLFDLADGSKSYNVPAQTTVGMVFGDDYWGTVPKISDTIQPGLYHLSWTIQFNVVSGSFEHPPDLTIPWDVTILG